MTEIIRKRPSSANFGTGPDSQSLYPSSSSQSTSLNKRRKPQILKTKILNPVDASTGLSKCFYIIEASLYVSLGPSYLNKPLEGIKAQHLDTLILKYYPPVCGVVIGYDGVRLSNEANEGEHDDEGGDEDGSDNGNGKVLAKINPHTPFAFMWITVKFLVWKPMIGDIVEGYIYMQSPSHIGLLINDTFNASIKKFNIPNDWKFIPSQVDETQYDDGNNDDDGDNNDNNNNNNSNDALKDKKSSTTLGQWMDGDSMPIDGKLTFTIKAIHNTGRVVSVEGSLLKPGKESDSLPVVPNAKSVNKKIKFDDDLDINGDGADLPLTAAQDDATELPGYDQSNSSDSEDDSEKDSDGREVGGEEVVAEASSSEDDDSDSD